MPIERGIVEYFGSHGSERKCGYCKSIKPSLCDYGMWSHQLTPFEYFDLMERGWRRSGKYLYKPINERTCCPTYPIKCDILNFVPSKSQKRVIKTVNDFLLDGKKPNPKDSRVQKSQERKERISKEHKIVPEQVSKRSEPRKTRKMARIEKKVQKLMLKNNCDHDLATKLAIEQHENRLKNRLGSKIKSLEQLLVLPSNKEPKHKLELKLVRTCFVNDKSSEKNFLDHILPIEHAVYVKYQTTIHGDDIADVTAKQYQRFLVDSPLLPMAFPTKIQSRIDLSNYGSHHLQFWLDDKILIAVGIVDIVTRGWSSVYFFYDPDYQFMSLGTYSALCEISLVREIVSKVPDFKNYFMGYYIHDCPKMRYKGKFKPSYLLCPEVKSWWPLEYARPLLDSNKYSRLDPDVSKIDSDAEDIVHEQIEVLYASNGMTTFDYYLELKKSEATNSNSNSSRSDDDPDLDSIVKKVEEYAKVAGRKAVQSILLYLE